MFSPNQIVMKQGYCSKPALKVAFFNVKAWNNFEFCKISDV